MSAPSLIAIDWGTTSFRAFLLDTNGQIVDRVASRDGVLSSTRALGFEECLKHHCMPWVDRYGSMPIIMAGAIGSREGWQQTDYLTCPLTRGDLADNLLNVPNSLGWSVHIVPGARGINLFGQDDIMRGEETQVLGAAMLLETPPDIYCLPGTHSKWCALDAASVTSLTTFMTGEVFERLVETPSLKNFDTHRPEARESDSDRASFLLGVRAATPSAGLLSDIFGLRSRLLLKETSALIARDVLSGIIIGHEVKTLLNAKPGLKRICLIGDHGLCLRYEAALSELGVESVLIPAERAFAEGIKALHSAASSRGL